MTIRIAGAESDIVRFLAVCFGGWEVGCEGRVDMMGYIYGRDCGISAANAMEGFMYFF